MKVKNLLLTTVFVFGFLFAKSQIVSEGDKILNLGLGLGTNLYSGSYYSGTFPPLSASLEVVVNDDLFSDGKGALGVGGYLGYSGFKSEYHYTSDYYGWKYSNIIVGPRGYVHYNFLDKLDTYTGILIGYWISSSKSYGTDAFINDIDNGNYGGLAWSWFIGGRYYFNDNLAIMMELGYGISYLNVGVAFSVGK